ncbi:sodium:solute symporter family protein [Lentimicrobium sp.]|jgi:Na+/proline symporter|uniref:sodium:solute symporter family protein n=1 Tax=Lentimicrobium sp. TaxID=2034841 RepID=UPI002C6C0001|nr:sodium:solute symporter family protein [Lentimicrobium sp.]HPF64495.1 Na+:solute symporter [Lentimicrobium sp.]HPR26079.1 Na+:solute symporter [Lentimicrobium sp.]HRW69401.1 Na+:solute symporter [Lentimicrobium sp.]
MLLQSVDWIIIAAFFVILLTIGYLASKNASRSAADFFVSGRSMPWWLLGVSMVATTFSCDTPNLVTDMVRQNGVAANWMWWAFLLTGMLTVFIYAKLWNRSKVLTDLEFYEIRYSGKTAAFLRGFRAIYLGFFFNVMVIASVSLAFIKIAAVMLGLSPAIALIIAAVVVVFYSGLGGLKSILYTDLFQFSMAMIGAFGAAWYVTTSPDVGGLQALLSHPDVSGKLSLIPDINQSDVFLSILIVPLAVQWWAAWYPGAEPGGGGYVAQRMLSAKSEKHAMGATLLFNFFHYALRPWPWIIVGLASLIVFPDIASLRTAFPNVPAQFIQHDFAYPAMLARYLPVGFLGLVVASLIAAFMSTVASQVNWGSSYLVNDFYARFLNKSATEKQKVLVGRISTVTLMFFSVLLALVLENALQAFQYMLMIGAGTGLIYILRWFWWRINAFTELTAMVAAGVFSLAFILTENLFLVHTGNGMVELGGITLSFTVWNIVKFIGVVAATSLAWIIVTYLTPPSSDETLQKFYTKIRPGGPGWKAVRAKALTMGIDLQKEDDLRWDVPTGILCMLLGCVAVYSILFSTGFFLYGKTVPALAFLSSGVIASFLLSRTWKKLKTR